MFLFVLSSFSFIIQFYRATAFLSDMERLGNADAVSPAVTILAGTVLVLPAEGTAWPTSTWDYLTHLPFTSSVEHMCLSAWNWLYSEKRLNYLTSAT